uniref:Ribosomal protein S3 n=1 Tax=Gelidium sclerophyllum TaxID=317102 RepID=A0A1D8X7I6_9FLOR|nr:ribosomal protein S3 [Gelidium sclerophyllum]AOX48984.1 ribosomal protein S3 [Gelidium sclerophyllum]
MAQKTNPIGLRLGTNQVWDLIVQKYGKKQKSYLNFLKKQFLFNHFFLQHTEFKNVGLLVQKYLIAKYTSNNINFIYNTSLVLPNSTLPKELIKKTQLVLKDTFGIEVNMKLFFSAKSTLTANLLTAYVNYLFEQNFTLKKIISNLILFLKSQLGARKIIYLKNAVQELELIGFKVKISGRFENTRNRMAKTYEQNIGFLSLTCLKNVVEFHNQVIYTKLGTCSFQVWLFYKS